MNIIKIGMKVHIVLIIFIKYNIRYFDLQIKYRIVNNKELIFKFKKLEVDDFQIILNKNLYIVYMENYINILRCILNNFNKEKEGI